MKAPRYAQRTDGNQSLVVDALRKAGATVHICKLPFDLMVSAISSSGVRKMAYFEVKNSQSRYGKTGMKHGGNANQQAFLKANPGTLLFFVDSPESAIAMFREMVA